MALLSFESESLRDFCEDDSKILIELPDNAAQNLVHRLSDLLAAESISDLLVGNPRSTIFEDQQVFEVTLNDDFSLIFLANHRKIPMSDDEMIDWEKVTRFKLLMIKGLSLE